MICNGGNLKPPLSKEQQPKYFKCWYCGEVRPYDGSVQTDYGRVCGVCQRTVFKNTDIRSTKKFYQSVRCGCTYPEEEMLNIGRNEMMCEKCVMSIVDKWNEIGHSNIVERQVKMEEIISLIAPDDITAFKISDNIRKYLRFHSGEYRFVEDVPIALSVENNMVTFSVIDSDSYQIDFDDLLKWLRSTNLSFVVDSFTLRTGLPEPKRHMLKPWSGRKNLLKGS